MSKLPRMAEPSLSSEPSAEFRRHLPDLNSERFTKMRTQNAHEYADTFFRDHNPPWLYQLVQKWRQLHKEPYKGLTNDGHVRPGLFQLQDEELPIEEIVAAVERVFSNASDEQRKKLLYPLDAPEWRSWSNPEILISPNGLRLDEVNSGLRDAILRVLEVTLSPEGYTKALGAMRINGFLGELVKAPAVMNEFSYNFVLFGKPSTTDPWGWSFYGHHLCLNVFLYKRQIVVSPFFTGAEPNIIDEGPYRGTQILLVEDKLGLDLMRSLPAAVQQTAQIYKELHDPAMPADRWNRDEQRHLCGAFHDNRIVPYEGVLVSTFSVEQKATVLAIFEQYLLYLPKKSRQMKLEQIEKWFSETHFSWIGGYGETDSFYYRIQSPVIVVEFDHHSGVFLTNEEPARFHIHTILRTPNAGDYGAALQRLIAQGPVEG